MQKVIRGLTLLVLIPAFSGCEVVAEPPTSNALDTRAAEAPSVAEVVSEPLPPPPAALAPQANLLEEQVIRVFETAGPGGVNITSRSISSDFFLRAMAQEGSGSGGVEGRVGRGVRPRRRGARRHQLPRHRGSERAPRDVLRRDPGAG